MKNLGTMDAGLRITAGLTVFGIGIYKRKPLVIALGALEAASGMVRYCPMYALAGLDSCNPKKKLIRQLKHAVRACTCGHQETHDHEQHDMHTHYHDHHMFETDEMSGQGDFVPES